MALFISGERSTIRSLAVLQGSLSNPYGGSAGGGGGGGGREASQQQQQQQPQHSTSPSSQAPVELVEEDMLMEGFILYVRPDWLLDRERLFKTFAVWTQDASDAVRVSIARFNTPSSTSGPNQTQHGSIPNLAASGSGSGSIQSLNDGGQASNSYHVKIRRAFARFESDGLKPLQTRNGIIMISKDDIGGGTRPKFPQNTLSTPDPSSAEHAATKPILIPKGDYDTHLSNLKLLLNLIQLGASDRFSIACRPPTEAETEKFYLITGIKEQPSIPLNVAVTRLITLTQRCLGLLGLLCSEEGRKGPTSIRDGFACDKTIRAMEDFFHTFGPFEQFTTVQDDTWLDPTLITILFQTVWSLRHHLDSIGFHPPKDMSGWDLDAYEKTVKHFQRANNLPVTRVLDEATIRLIREMVEKENRGNDPVSAVSTSFQAIRTRLEDFIPGSNAHRQWDLLKVADSAGAGGGTRQGQRQRRRGYDITEEKSLDFFMQVADLIANSRAARDVQQKEQQQQHETKQKERSSRRKKRSGGNETVRTTGTSGSTSSGPLLPSQGSGDGLGLVFDGIGMGGGPAFAMGPNAALFPATAGPAVWTPQNPPTSPTDPTAPTSSSKKGIKLSRSPQHRQQTAPVKSAAPARMLKGFANTTSRTIGGIVEKGKNVGKRLTHLVTTDLPNNPPASTSPTSPTSPANSPPNANSSSNNNSLKIRLKNGNPDRNVSEASSANTSTDGAPTLRRLGGRMKPPFPRPTNVDTVMPMSLSDLIQDSATPVVESPHPFSDEESLQGEGRSRRRRTDWAIAGTNRRAKSLDLSDIYQDLQEVHRERNDISLRRSIIAPWENEVAPWESGGEQPASRRRRKSSVDQERRYSLDRALETEVSPRSQESPHKTDGSSSSPAADMPSPSPVSPLQMQQPESEEDRTQITERTTGTTETVGTSNAITRDPLEIPTYPTIDHIKSISDILADFEALKGKSGLDAILSSPSGHLLLDLLETLRNIVPKLIGTDPSLGESSSLLAAITNRLESAATEREAKLMHLEKTFTALIASQRASLSKVEGLNNATMKAKYGVAVLESRVEEAEESTDAFLARLVATEGKVVTRWGPIRASEDV
ncbi:hypothetical protein HDU97_002110 [Phlyctochytrium planicorne]|nr:hypothetical protein HDU97_002110 [Phlyctochytrium planicorne]